MAKRKNRPIEEVIDSKRDLAREYAVENTPVRLDGVGEHPAIQAAASPAFATMSNEDAFNVALQLQQIVRGQASILDNQTLLTENLNKVTEKMRKYDEAAQKWEEDKLKFMEEVNRKADRLRITDPAKLGEMSAQVMQEEARAVDIAKALQAQNKAKFIDVINRAPKVRVMSPGVVEQGRIGDQPIVRLVPEVIRIKNFEWKLPPGVPVEVPDFVAKRFEQIQQQRAELAERQQALSADRNNGAMSDASEVTARMAQIDKKYGVATPSE